MTAGGARDEFSGVSVHVSYPRILSNIRVPIPQLEAGPRFCIPKRLPATHTLLMSERHFGQEGRKPTGSLEELRLSGQIWA